MFHSIFGVLAAMATFGGGFFHAVLNNRAMGTSTDRMRGEHEGDRGMASTTLREVPPWLEGSSTRPGPGPHGTGTPAQRRDFLFGTTTPRRSEDRMSTSTGPRAGFVVGMIASLRADGLTVIQPDGKAKIVSVRALTQIHVRGTDSSEAAKATLADLKVGQYVVVRGLPTPAGTIIAELIQEGMPMPMGRPDGRPAVRPERHSTTTSEQN